MTPSHLYQLIYSSEATSSFNKSDLFHLVEQARDKNYRHQITGLLLFYNQFFLQILEGTQHHITTLFNVILQDKRHHNVLLLKQAPVLERQFPQWSMGIANFPGNIPSLSPEQFAEKNLQLNIEDHEYLQQLTVDFSKGALHKSVQFA